MKRNILIAFYLLVTCQLGCNEERNPKSDMSEVKRLMHRQGTENLLFVGTLTNNSRYGLAVKLSGAKVIAINIVEFGSKGTLIYPAQTVSKLSPDEYKIIWSEERNQLIGLTVSKIYLPSKFRVDNTVVKLNQTNMTLKKWKGHVQTPVK